MGDKASNVKKKYGSASKRKVNKTEIFYKSVKYDSNYGMVDLSLWKSYLEYTYKRGSDKYQIRFYLDKKEKVSAVAYLKNLDKFYNYPNKQVKSGLTFKAPKGKKVTIKTINGKKVYLLPKGTKISFNKGSISKSKFEYLQLSVCRYDEYGKFTEGTDAQDLVKNRKWKQGKKYSLSDFMKTASWDCVVDYYTAEPFCCKMSIFQCTKDNSGYAKEDTKVAPEQFYFILEGDSWYCKP